MVTASGTPFYSDPTGAAPTGGSSAYYAAIQAAKAAGSQGGGTTPALTPDQSNAFALMSDTLTQWGLASLIPDLRNLIVQGDTNSDTLSLALSQTQAYKERFAGNEIRQQKGLPALTPAQYIATEEQYRNAMQAYGLPSGYFDKPQDFTNLIGNDVSPSEVAERAQVAHDQYLAAPDDWKSLWKSYGFTDGDAIASILDPNVGTQIIKDRAGQVAIGGAAADQGFAVSQQRAQQFQQQGVTLAGAQKAYAQIAQSLPTDSAIAQRFGTQFGQTQEENDLLLNSSTAAQTRNTLYHSEEALFKGTASADSNALGVSQAH